MVLPKKASQELQAEVRDGDLCTLCGSCVGLCPYVKAYKGQIRMIDKCDRDQGRCYLFCPRTLLDLDSISQAVFGFPYRATELGEVQEVLMAQTTDAEIKGKAQHGGTVSSLIILALEKGIIDAAVLTKSENLIPQGVIAQNRSEVLKCGGSNFLASPTLEAFNTAAKGDLQRIGFVGMPCQVLALAKRKVVRYEDDNSIDKLALTIGLFCTWELAHSFIDRISQEASRESVRKMDVPSKAANVFQVFGSNGVVTIPLDEIRDYVRPACAVCMDMTAEFADISVGVARGMPDWNTVIIRTEKGKKLFEEAKKAGLIVTDALATESLQNLKRASLQKKKRALQEIVARTGNADDLLYLEPKPKEIGALLSD